MIGNKTEEVFDNTDNNNNLITNVRQKVALYLDPRLKRCATVMNSEGWKKARYQFGNRYLNFYTHMKLNDMKLKKEKQKENKLSGKTPKTDSIESNKNNILVKLVA